MNNVFWIIVLISSCVSCYNYDEVPWNVEEYEHQYDGNPDDFAMIYRPCQVYDLNCIRQFFAEHSHCIIARGPLANTIYRSQFSEYLPQINLTVTLTNSALTGLNNTRIEEFYVNKATNNVVFAIELRNINMIINGAYFQFHRRAREPVVTATVASVLYRSLTITAVIPNIDGLQLDKAEVTTYLHDPVTPFTIGPEVADSSDPVVVQSLVELNADVPTALQETKMTELIFYSPTYIQTYICDFGLKTL